MSIYGAVRDAVRGNKVGGGIMDVGIGCVLGIGGGAMRVEVLTMASAGTGTKSQRINCASKPIMLEYWRLRRNMYCVTVAHNLLAEKL